MNQEIKIIKERQVMAKKGTKITWKNYDDDKKNSNER